jgi:hypothetical protein
MSRLSRLPVLFGAVVLAAPVFLARPAQAESKARMSIQIETDEGSKVELETGADWLQGLISGADVTCDADHDRSTRKMMSSLTRQGEGGVYHGEDEDGGDFVARRRSGMLRIEKDDDDGERMLVEMPWDVAQCLMAGIEPAGDLGKRLARGEAKLRFETEGESGARVSIRLE